LTDFAPRASRIPHVLRSLRRAPGFVAIAALSLGVALGLSTTVFGVIDAMRHPYTGIRDVEQVFHTELFTRGNPPGPLAAEWEQTLRQLPVVDAVASMRTDRAVVETNDRVERRMIAYTHAGFWRLLDIPPRVGRLPTDAEAADGNVAVVSDSLWRKQYGDLRTIGPAKLTIAGRQYAIVGVLPRNSAVPWYTDVFVPEPATVNRSSAIVRLKPHVSEKQLSDAMTVLAKRFTALYVRPGERPFSTVVRSVAPDPLEIKDFHRAMVGAAIGVLLIACANIAALMLARGMAKRRDYALQLALGASPRTIFLQVGLEVAVLSAIGTAVGAVAGAWCLDFVTRATPEEMHWLGFVQPQWSWRVLAQSAAAVALSLAIAGGFPAWRASRIDPAGPLKEGSGGNTGRVSGRFRLLVVAELAVAMTLLVSSSLMFKSVSKMRVYDYGYDARPLVLANFWLFYRDTTSEEARRALARTWLDRVRDLPSVQAAATIHDCSAEKRIVISDKTSAGGPSILLGGCMNVSAEFFRVLGAPIIAGRDFSDADAEAGGAAILDRRTASHMFGDESPLGHFIKLGDERSARPWLRVVGVVENIRLGFNPYPEMGPDTSNHVYVAQQADHALGAILARPRRGDTTLPSSMRRILFDLLPSRSSIRVRKWTEEYDAMLTAEQFLLLMFSLLGFASLLLGAAGLFSVISYIGTQRNREFAVRIALGATSRAILGAVMRDALAMALGGTAIGAGAGMAAGFLLWDKMWGVYPVDAGALILAEATLLAVTLLACIAPALRATRADPLEIIRAT